MCSAWGSGNSNQEEQQSESTGEVGTEEHLRQTTLPFRTNKQNKSDGKKETALVSCTPPSLSLSLSWAWQLHLQLQLLCLSKRGNQRHSPNQLNPIHTQMASLFRDRGDASSRRESLTSPLRDSTGGVAATSLPSPFGSLALSLSDPDLRDTAYEIFVSACRTSAGSRPLTYTPQSDRSTSGSPSPSSATSASPSSSSPSLQRSLTSAAASKVKKALGLKSKSGKGGDANKTPTKKAATIGELMRIQMRIPEQADARIRRGLLRIAASQVSFSEIYFFLLPHSGCKICSHFFSTVLCLSTLEFQFSVETD